MKQDYKIIRKEEAKKRLMAGEELRAVYSGVPENYFYSNSDGIPCLIVDHSNGERTVIEFNELDTVAIYRTIKVWFSLEKMCIVSRLGRGHKTTPQEIALEHIKCFLEEDAPND